MLAEDHGLPASTGALPSALVILDMFTSFGVGTDRTLRRRASRAIPAIATLIERARAASQTIVYVVDRGDDWSAAPADVVSAAEGRSGGTALEALRPAPGDPFLFRVGPSAFDESGLEQLLLSRGVRRVVLAGQVTERGVLHAALDASGRGFEVAVPREAVVTDDTDLAEAALAMMERHSGAVVCPLSGVIFSRASELSERRRVPRAAPAAFELPNTPTGTSGARQELLAAFAVVVGREGFAGARVADVAREARISLRTFYSEFASKEECFLELYELTTRGLAQAVRNAVVFNAPLPEVTRRGFETYFGLLTSAPGLTQAFLLELVTLSPEARVARERAMDQFAGLLVQLTNEGIEANPELPSRPLTHLGARALVGAMLELFVSHAAQDETERLGELVDTATQMLLGLVLDPGASVVEARPGAAR